MKHPAETQQLNVVARAPFQVYYEGVADVLTAANRIGEFDVLPGHADFFSMLIPGEVTIDTGKTGEQPVTFPITNGIITVRDNQVLLFVNM